VDKYRVGQKNAENFTKIGDRFPVAAGFQFFGSPPLETTVIKGGKREKVRE
jgi:hypothetical protein